MLFILWFGTDPHMGRSGGGPTGGSGAGPSGGPGGKPGGESNNMYKDPSEFLNNANFINDRIGDGADILANTQNKGGSLGVWKNSANSFKIRYYSSNWKGNQYTGKTANVSKMLKKGTVVASAVLGAIEVSQGVAQDYQNYETNGYTDGKNTAVATGSVIGGIGGAWAGAKGGAAVGAAVGVWFGGAGAVPGALIGGIIGGFIGSELGSSLGSAVVEEIYR